jgi:hypothetical protein
MGNSRSSVKYKRGDVHPETGLVFWAYQKDCKDSQRWVSASYLQESKNRRNQKLRERYIFDEDFRNKTKLRNKNWHKQNPECKIKSGKKYRQKHPDKNYNYWLKFNYGITRDEYDKIFLSQNGKCAICESSFCPTGKRFAVDHDHKTGKIRGLLCQPCNTSLGQMKDSPELLRKAADYLEK